MGAAGWVFSARSARQDRMREVKVLVVEDDEKIASAVARGLEAEGFRVAVAVDGHDGLWRAREGAYDLIVLDIMLPGRNGFQVCADLRAEGIWTPILMLTAKDGDLDEAEALETGADDYLSKPFSFPGWWPACGHCFAARSAEARRRCRWATSASTHDGGGCGGMARRWR